LHGEHIDESNVPFWILPFIRFQRAFENGFDRFRNGYRALLASCFEHRKPFAVFFLAFCVGSWLLLETLGQNFFPSVDTGQFLLHLRAPTGTRIEETERLAGQFNSVIRSEIPSGELGGILDNIGIPNSSINLSYNTSGVIGTGDADILVSLKRGHAPTMNYVRRLRARLSRGFPGMMIYFLPADIVSQTLNFSLPAPFDVQIVGRDQVKNRELAERLQILHHSAVGLANRLVLERYARRVPSQKDRRQVFLALTTRGEIVLEKLSAVHREQLQRVGPQIIQLLRGLRGNNS
jgi:multidrug efflux pump subunit AcrB